VTGASLVSCAELRPTRRELAHGLLQNDPRWPPATSCGAARGLQRANSPCPLSSNLNPCAFERRQVPTGFSYIRLSGCDSANRR
jgi:hypothetical protein